MTTVSNILSLAKARKAKARLEKEAKASQNRMLFGLTKAEKNLRKAELELARKRIDDHKMTKDEPDA
jgi:hypothetical protein